MWLLCIYFILILFARIILTIFCDVFFMFQNEIWVSAHFRILQIDNLHCILNAFFIKIIVNVWYHLKFKEEKCAPYSIGTYHSVLYPSLKVYFSMAAKLTFCDHDKIISTTHRDTQILIITHPNKVVDDVTIDKKSMASYTNLWDYTTIIYNLALNCSLSFAVKCTLL